MYNSDKGAYEWKTLTCPTCGQPARISGRGTVGGFSLNVAPDAKHCIEILADPTHDDVPEGVIGVIENVTRKNRSSKFPQWQRDTIPVLDALRGGDKDIDSGHHAGSDAVALRRVRSVGDLYPGRHCESDAVSVSASSPASGSSSSSEQSLTDDEGTSSPATATSPKAKTIFGKQIGESTPRALLSTRERAAHADGVRYSAQEAPAQVHYKSLTAACGADRFSESATPTEAKKLKLLEDLMSRVRDIYANPMNRDRQILDYTKRRKEIDRELIARHRSGKAIDLVQANEAF